VFLSSIVDSRQLPAVEAIIRAAMAGFGSSFTPYRLARLENKLRRKSSRLQ
jgi:hypothetical protein